jgi:hypothetical protein
VCKCYEIEQFIRSDTGGEYVSVYLRCLACGRSIEVIELTTHQEAAMKSLHEL